MRNMVLSGTVLLRRLLCTVPHCTATRAQSAGALGEESRTSTEPAVACRSPRPCTLNPARPLAHLLHTPRPPLLSSPLPSPFLSSPPPQVAERQGRYLAHRFNFLQKKHHWVRPGGQDSSPAGASKVHAEGEEGATGAGGRPGAGSEAGEQPASAESIQEPGMSALLDPADKPFVYRHLGSMATIGRYSALVDLRENKVRPCVASAIETAAQGLSPRDFCRERLAKRLQQRDCRREAVAKRLSRRDCSIETVAWRLQLGDCRRGTVA